MMEFHHFDHHFYEVARMVTACKNDGKNDGQNDCQNDGNACKTNENDGKMMVKMIVKMKK